MNRKTLLIVLGVWLGIILVGSLIWIVINNQSEKQMISTPNKVISMGAYSYFTVDGTDSIKGVFPSSDYDKLIKYLLLSAKYNIETTNGLPTSQDDKDYLANKYNFVCNGCSEIDPYSQPGKSDYGAAKRSNLEIESRIKKSMFDNVSWDQYFQTPEINDILTLQTYNLSNNIHELSFSESISDRIYNVTISDNVNNLTQIKISLLNSESYSPFIIDDALLESCSIIKKLPYENYIYSIGYTVNVSKKSLPTISIVIDSFQDTVDQAVKKYLELSDSNSSKCRITYINTSNPFMEKVVAQ